ncbi:ZAR1-like protein isoform X2 [Varanus komodoensis]|uniref:ZAR1-like protein isoform X2 n=1 Tax=Varanus komodoensis TaxID=61221 RepID=UPI001CF7E2BF|nr:ZAR1-like protein isoform X2 [Varanus komodoensis]
MEHFVYPPYGVYQSYANTFTSNHNVPPKPPSKQKQPSWKQSKSSGTPTDYLDTYKRAQLKALLSQVSPGLPPRLHKASTKEVGIQVNPRVDAAVQCSLGSRPLQAVRPQSPSGRLSREPPLLGVYSPIVGRRLCTLPEVVVEPTEQEEAPTSQQPSEEAKGQVLEAVAVTASEEAAAATNSEKRDEESGQLQDGKGGVASTGGSAEEGKKSTFQILYSSDGSLLACGTYLI